MKNSVQSIIIRVLGNFLEQSGILAAITSLLGVTLFLFCPRGPLGHFIFSHASGYYANKTSSFKFGGNG